MKKLGIFLALVMILGSTPLGFSDPLRVQLEQGIETEQLQCDNDSHVLVLRANGNYACVSERSAERMGWEKVSHNKIAKPEIFEISTEIQSITNIGDDTVQGELGNPYLFPQYELKFPKEVIIGQPFHVTYEYSFMIPEIDNDKFGNEFEIWDKPKRQCSAEQCGDYKLDIRRFANVEIIDNNKFVFDKNFKAEGFKANPSSIHGHIQPVFDNTKKMSEKFTFVINEPEIDTPFGEISISMNAQDGRIYFQVLPNGFVNLSNEKLLDENGKYPFDEDYKHIFIKTYPDQTNKTIPEDQFDSLYEFWETNHSIISLEDFLRQQNFTENIIQRFLEKYGLETQSFESFSYWILPQAFGQSSTSFVYGNLKHTDKDGNTVGIEGVKICAFDVSSGSASPVYNGNTHICNETGSNGSFSLVAVPLGTELVIEAYAEHDYFIVYQNSADSHDVYANENVDITSTTQSYGDANLPDSQLSNKAFWVIDQLDDIREWYISELSYSPSLLNVHWYIDDCLGVGLTYAGSNHIDLDDTTKTTQTGSESCPNVVISSLTNTDTLGHEYAHFNFYQSYDDKNSSYPTYSITNSDNIHSPVHSNPSSTTWIEGWAFFMATAYSKSPIYQPSYMIGQWNFETRTHTETSDSNFAGKDFVEGVNGEGNVAAILWDAFDSTSEDSLDDQSNLLTSIWDTLRDNLETGESVIAEDILEYRDDWNDNSYPSLDNIYTLNTIPVSSGGSSGTIILENWEVILLADAHNQIISDYFVVTLNTFDTLVFDYTISSEANYDKGRIYIDDVLIFETSGESVDTFTYTATSGGSKTIKIEYYKDGSVSTGDDLFRIDTLTHFSSDETIGNLIFEDNLNTDLSNWTLSGDTDWEIGQYSFDQPPFADNAVYNVATINNCDDFCIMEIALDLGNYDELYLNFWYFVDEDVNDEEGLKVEISLNSGNTWDEIFYWYEDNGNTHTWEELRNYDISEYAGGSSFNLRFTAISSASSEDMMLANFALRGILGDTGGGGTSNNAPTITITSPSIGSEFDEGDSITFTASVIDDNDSDINSNISWSSNHDGALGTGSSINTSSLSVNTHIITASVTDSGGLSDSDEIIIIVLVVPDITAPVITVPIDVTFNATEILTPLDETDFGTATAIDDVDQSPTITNDAPTEFPLGDTIIIWTATDLSENNSTDTQTITVQDIVNPTIALLGDIIQTIELGDSYTELGATAIDNVDGDITANIIIDSSAVDVNEVGTYSVTYDVSDSSSNPATQVIRTVNVVDTIAPIAVSAVTDGEEFTTLDDARGITTVLIDGSTYALVASFKDDGIQIINISDPTDPTAVSAVTDGEEFTALDGAVSIATIVIDGSTYALVGSYFDDGIQIINISDPTDLTVVSTVTDGKEFTALNAVRDITTVLINNSTYAIVASYFDDGIQIIDISNPYLPTAVSTVTDGEEFTELDGARAITTVLIDGSTYAIIGSYDDDGVQIIDISNPYSPTAVSAVTDGEEFTALVNARDITTVLINNSTYALVTSDFDDGIQIIDISNPYSPTAVSAVTDGEEFTALDGAVGITTIVNDGITYALVAGHNDDGIQIIDISNPYSPTAVSAVTDGEEFTELDGAHGVTIVLINNTIYALVTGNFDDGVQIIDIDIHVEP